MFIRGDLFDEMVNETASETEDDAATASAISSEAIIIHVVTMGIL